MLSPVDYYVIIASDDFFKVNNFYTDNTSFQQLIHDEELAALFESVIKEYDNKDELSNLSILSLLMSIFITLRRKFTLEEKSSLPLDNNKVKMIRDAIAFIRENYREKRNTGKVRKARKTKLFPSKKGRRLWTDCN